MDPNVALARILDAAARGDAEAYTDACEDLAEWLRNGGFPPALPEGLQYVPGVGTDWTILSPVMADGKWCLVHWRPNGATDEVFDLEED